MTTFDLTAKEFQAASHLVQACLDNMGGDRPADLEHDEYTWVDLGDLVNRGGTETQAKDEAELARLQERGITPVVVPDDDPDHNPGAETDEDEADLFAA
jgi:hypothetical protein